MVELIGGTGYGVLSHKIDSDDGYKFFLLHVMVLGLLFVFVLLAPNRPKVIL